MSYPILYEQINNVGTVPNDNGLGVLTDCLECMVTEERNGSYELELQYPVNGLHSKELKERRILKAKPNYTDDPQLFRIYKIGKVLNDKFTVYARHISYDLSGYTITSGTATSCVLACDLLQNKANNWNINTDKEVVANFTILEPSSVRSWFGGKEGSFLDVFGTGEWHYDNFTCSFLQHRGTNRGVTVKYAKNLLSLNQDIESSNIITGVLPYWKDSQDGTVVLGNTQSTSVALDVPNVYVLDCSSDFQNPPTTQQLNDKATNYINNHQNDIAKQNIKLNFLQIGLLKDRVDLCDTVTIEYPDFEISGTAKCITTTWDVLKDRYDSIEIGEPKTNIADTIVSVQKTSNGAITPTQMNGAIDRATALITGNSGGYVVLHDSNNDGQPDELLIMNTPDITTATKVWRWNLGGLGYSSTGYSGTYGTAMTMDGAINCAFLKTGNIIFGGTDGNTNGSLTIRDASNNVIANFNKSGCTVKGNITADSFTADAGNNVNVKILTRATSLQPIGTLSGIIINNINSSYDNAFIGVNDSSSSYSSAMAVSQSTSGHPFISLLRTMTGINSATNYKDKYTGIENWLMENDISYSGVSEIRTHYQQTGNDKSINSFVDCTVEDDNTSSNNTSAYLAAKITNGTKSAFLSLQQSGTESAISIFANNNPFIQITNKNHIEIAYLGTTSSNGGYLYLRNSSGTLLHQLDIQSGGGYIGVRNSSGTGTISLWGHNGNVTCVSLTQTSTRKVKENIEELTEDEAKKVLDLQPVIYDFKDNELGTNKRGFIAEDVIEVIPEIVTTDEDDEPQGINYTEIIPYLTKMIQIQQKQIEQLEARVKELEERSL